MAERQAAVAAGHEGTADAAAEVLAAGGGAVDAAIAAVWAACVAEPILTGPLGAGLLAYSPPEGEPLLLDFFAHTPGLGGARGPVEDLDFVAVDVCFGPAVQVFHIGRGAAATPGCVAGLFEAHRRWGRFPMSDLVAPACRLAREGVVVSDRMAQMMRFLKPILVHTAAARQLYAPRGDLLRGGERFLNPDLADTLETLADQGPAAVHGDGALGRRAVEAFGPPHGLLTAQDLRHYAPTLRTPLVQTYHGSQVVLPPRPTAGGPLVAHSLSALEGRHEDDPLVALAEAMRTTHTARNDVLNHLGSTTHVSVVDRQGAAVAITTSNGESGGHLVPGTGIAMNNFLGEGDINPDGFHSQRPGEGMLTMMCPTILRQPDGRVTVLGSGGSNRIRSAVLRVSAALADDSSLSLQAAVDLPRIHVEGDLINLETAGLSPARAEALEGMFSKAVRFSERNMFFGGVHAVRTGPAGVECAGDPRRGGVFRVVEAS